MIGRVRGLLRQRSVARFTVLLLVLGLFGLVLLLAPRPEVAELPRLADRLGRLAPVAAIGGGALLLVALVPRTAITVVWGRSSGRCSVPATRWPPPCSPRSPASRSAGCSVGSSSRNGYAADWPGSTAGSPGRACSGWSAYG
ncbi:hypothetical protein GCM10027615_72830 [Plantactinospora veratri]